MAKTDNSSATADEAEAKRQQEIEARDAELKNREAELSKRENELNARASEIADRERTTDANASAIANNGVVLTDKPAGKPREFTPDEQARVASWADDRDGFARDYFDLEEKVNRLLRNVFGAGGG